MDGKKTAPLRTAQGCGTRPWPPSGLAPGDYLQVELEGERLILTPKALIEKRVAEGLEDIRRGRVHGPFKSMPALLRSLHRTKKTKAS